MRQEAQISAATSADVVAMAALLKNAGLPSRFIEEHLPHFLVLRADGAVRGCAGMEIYADSCLLRSLVVQEEYRGRGWGSALIEALLARARELQLREVVALTATAAELVRRFGFVEVARKSIAPALRSSWEFAEDGCARASCLRLILSY